jgi:hypothetical protein
MRCCVNARKHRSQRLQLCDLRPLGLFEDAGQVPRQAGACQSLFFAPRRCDFDRGGRDVALSCLQTSVNVFQWREAFLVCAFDWRFACVLRACCLRFAGVVRGLCVGCARVVRGVHACLRPEEATAARYVTRMSPHMGRWRPRQADTTTTAIDATCSKQTVHAASTRVGTCDAHPVATLSSA